MRDQLPKEILLDGEDAVEATAHEFESAVLARAEISQVRSALQELPDNQRIALTLWLTEDLPYEDIARELGVSEGAVKQLLFRARQSLSEKIRRGA
jgi:RNA polymerase sigma factor (sigma-70 family)